MTTPVMRSRIFDRSRREEFLAVGVLERDVFAHRVLLVPKAGPDGAKLAARMGLRIRPDDHWQVVLHALPEALAGIPDDVWFDDDIVWHRQHLGLPGQIASASLFVDGTTMYSAAHQSDVVQRISRRRHLKTRIEKRFHGWDRMLLNALVALAAEKGMRALCVPTAATAMSHTDQARAVGPELFDRIYDRHVHDRFSARPDGGWWRIDVDANRERFVSVPVGTEPLTVERTVCVCHDIEAGHGHRDVDPDFAAAADRAAPQNLCRMLEVEQSRDVRATYNVLGVVWPDVHSKVRGAGHALGFHSFDHALGPPRRGAVRRRLGLDRAERRTGLAQLSRCRGLDGQVRGYRPPRSRLGPETDEARLAWFSFEWLASSTSSLGFATPQLEHGIVKLPIDRDDFTLHRGGGYEDWQDAVVSSAAETEVYAVSLHDCYADTWLPRYSELLGRLVDIGTLRTLDDVADDVLRANAI